jgi:hypothetical protein
LLFKVGWKGASSLNWASVAALNALRRARWASLSQVDISCGVRPRSFLACGVMAGV